MAEIEPPECPVCLQPYNDATAVIPRVLACGHSGCEVCLAQLPHPFSIPAAIRCPACTQIVNYPHPLGTAALTKNIDLLRLSLLLLDKSESDTKPSARKPTNQQQIDAPQRRRFVTATWSDELYSAWRDWVLPYDAVLVVNGGEEAGFCATERGKVVGLGSNGKGLEFGSVSPLIYRLTGDEEVKLVRIGCCGLDKCMLEYSYVAKVMSVLSRMNGAERGELASILKLTLRSDRVCKVYGLWFNEKSGYLYLVCERKNRTLLEMDEFCVSDVIRAEEAGTHIPVEQQVSQFAIIGSELCEALINLRSEGFVFGCLGMSCFCLDEFWHVYVDLSEVIVMGRMLRKCISMAVNRRENIDDVMEELLENIVKTGVLLSPEILFELLRSEGVDVGSSESKHNHDSSLDVWSLGCIFIKLLSRKQLTEDMSKYLRGLFRAKDDGELVNESKALYMHWVEQVTHILGASIGEHSVLLEKILVTCLDYDPESRPDLTGIWKGVKQLMIKSCFCFRDMVNLKGSVSNKRTANCLVLGEICCVLIEIENELRMGKLPKNCNEYGASCQAGEVRVHKELAGSISLGKVANIDLERHRDCVTKLSTGGRWLFSSSFDKTINMWSLQDFSHIHTFKGHQHRIMAVVVVDAEKPLCISGDNGGGIFIWEICTPFAQEPLKKWYEPKDWRYSGIYALVATGNEYLYTGSGDRLIKAWSLKDYTLSCSMEGHKSVVSSLAAFSNVLYSGSWDGTIRLWNLHDHSALAVLDEDVPGAISSIHSIYVDHQTVVAAYENGFVKIWLNDEIKRSWQVHDGAVLAISMEERWLFTGGWDRIVKVQEITEDEFQLDARQVGSIACDSVITALLCVQGRLFVGYGSGLIKAYHHE